jgi:hypothetical protein
MVPSGTGAGFELRGGSFGSGDAKRGHGQGQEKDKEQDRGPMKLDAKHRPYAVYDGHGRLSEEELLERRRTHHRMRAPTHRSFTLAELKSRERPSQARWPDADTLAWQQRGDFKGNGNGDSKGGSADLSVAPGDEKSKKLEEEEPPFVRAADALMELNLRELGMSKHGDLYPRGSDVEIGQWYARSPISFSLRSAAD